MKNIAKYVKLERKWRVLYTVYVIVANGRMPDTSISDWSFRGALLGFRKGVEAI